MADTKTTVKIGGDTTDFERALADLVKKTKEVQNQLKLSPAATRATPAGSPGYQTFQQEMQKTRAQEQKNKNEQEALKMTKRGLEEIDRQLATNARNEAKNSKDKAFYEKERNNFLKERITLQGTLNRLEGKGPDGVPLPQSGGGGGSGIGKGGITSLGGLAQFAGVPAMAIGGVATAVAAALAIEKGRIIFSQTENRARVAEASAFNTQGQGGQLLSSIFGGGANQEIMFSAQRAEAAKIAQDTMAANLAERNRAGRLLTHPTELIGELAKNATFGMWDPLRHEIESKRKDELANIQAEQEDAIKNGPAGAVRTQTANKFLKDWRRNLDFQRQTGLSEEGFRGFLGGVNRAGFADEQGMGMSSAILGAGGSTRAATGNATFALQMQRMFGLTNAGQAMGQLSGQLGSAGLSKDALIKIQAEGTRIGVNQADFVEENRKFVEMAAGVINQSNVTSGAGIDQVLSTLSSFMSGQKTTAGMKAGMTAYEAYQAQSNIQTGPSAAMRAGGMFQSAMLRSLPWQERNALYGLKENEITVDSSAVKAAATALGKSPQEIVDEMKGIQGRSIFQHASTDTRINNARMAADKAKSMTGWTPASRAAQIGAQQAEDLVVTALSGEEAYAGTSEKVRQAAAHARITGGDENAAVRAAREQEIAGKAAAGVTGRPGDEAERQQAEASRMANELFTSIQKSIVPAAEQTAIFTSKVDALVAAMKGHDAAAREAAAKALGFTSTPTPGEAGPSNPGTQ